MTEPIEPTEPDARTPRDEFDLGRHWMYVAELADKEGDRRDAELSLVWANTYFRAAELRMKLEEHEQAMNWDKLR